jgi:HTH-type transcriptional regulator/antitoxin HigA
MEHHERTEAVSPGDAIKRELEARAWTQADLADIIGRSPKEISDVVLGKRAISVDIAKELAAAFGTTARYWMELGMANRLARPEDAANTIARRARLYEVAPIKDMVRRRWLEPSRDVGVLEKRVGEFFGVSNLEQPIRLPHAMRRGNGAASPSQLAWVFRAARLAAAAPCTGKFSPRSLNQTLKDLRPLLVSTPEARQVPTILADAGIRFLVLEHLPQTRIDGVTLWLDAKSPVIALSLRYDRIDCFWHTLAHELGHVGCRDGMTRVMLDTAIVGEDFESAEQDAEIDADAFASDFLIKRSDLDGFIARIGPLYGRQRILGFAKRIGVHPGIVVGQLQFRGEIAWSAFRPMLEKVRSIVTQSALTDGWGHLAPPVS